jgi:asparagine synthase (glutamine-hydrolysing)
MCGILGLIETPWQDSAARALTALARRGPDASEMVSVGGAVLGHTRLAVIDVQGGHQPMRSPDGRHTLVFNGEIYNYQELRRELIQAGFRFATDSDTEVLLHGFAKWGSDLVPRLNGMFAFAVWDALEQTLFAARDRIGIKPFFYSTCRGFSFASTLKPFFLLDGFPRELDCQALRDFLAFQAVLAPHSFLAQVRQLPPAHWLRYDARKREMSSQQYWEIPLAEKCSESREELVREFDLILGRSVKRQVISDVPLGAFLSGGVDSSLMVHYMAQSGCRPLKTFSMRFQEAEFDETAHALAVARHYGAEHQVIDAPQIGPEQLVADLQALDQPLADPAYIMTCELARQTRRQVTVSLSGDGGDELFGGYARFRDQQCNYPPRLWKRLMGGLVQSGALPGSLLRRTLYGKEMLYYRKVELGPYGVSRKSLRRYVSDEVWRRSVPERTMGLWKDLLEGFGPEIDTASLMRADLWTYLSENCLVKTDRASMLHGLEVRVPMLDNEVLDRVLRLPADVHFQPGSKAILNELARRHLPEQVWNRPKHGFSVPLQNNFNNQWSEVCSDYVGRSSTLAPFLNEGAVGDLWNQARQGKASRRLVYSFIVLLIWLEQHQVTL